MFQPVELPVWLFSLILIFAVSSFASNFLFPSVRWFLRRRTQRIVDELNKRLPHPIEPFRLARRVDTIQRLIYDPEVVEAVIEHARVRGVREDVAFETAQRYAREIVPGFSATAYFGFAIRAARLLSTWLFEVRVIRADEGALDRIPAETTVVYVMNHRSNLDYVLVTYLAADRAALSYAVGEWARIWPLAPLIRAMGAYFIRRRDRDPLYRRILARYVATATDAGVTQAVFPEGGLSLTGGVAPLRLGILGYIAERPNPKRAVVFVPVALNYDRVLEDRILVEAGRRGDRRFRASVPEAVRFSLRYVRRRLFGRARRFGGAAVAFGAPIANDGLTLAELGDRLSRDLAGLAPVMPMPLVAAALLEGETGPERILERTAELRSSLIEAGHPSGFEASDLTVATTAALAEFARRELIETAEGRICPTAEGRPLLAYYANSLGLPGGREEAPPIAAT